MNHSRGLGIGLMGLAFVAAWAGAVYFYVAGYGSIPVGPLALPAVLFLFGFTFFFSDVGPIVILAKDNRCRTHRFLSPTTPGRRSI